MENQNNLNSAENLQPIQPQVVPEQPVQQPVQQVMEQPQMVQPQVSQPQPMVQPQFSQPVQQPVMAQPIQPVKKTNTVCVVALILAFLMGPIGTIVGIIGLVTANKNGEKGKGLAITAIILGILMPLIIIFGIFGLVLGLINGVSEPAQALQEACASVDANGNYVNEAGTVICKDFYCEYEKGSVSMSSSCDLIFNRDDEEDTNNETGSAVSIPSTALQQTSWILTDNSELVLDASTFTWYKTKDVYTDNYFKGTYVYYIGTSAVNYITNELSNYGVTKEELQGVFDRNEEYNEDNFVVLVLQHTGGTIEGKPYEKNTIDPYYGFLLNDGTYLDIANMNSASYYVFTKRVN